jgi:hypothetical protein
MSISFADENNRQKPYENFIITMRKAAPGTRKYNDYIANGLNLHFGQRIVDYQFWYY